MRLSVTALLSLTVAVTAGCAGQETPPAATGGPTQQPAMGAPTALEGSEDNKDPGKATIAVSDEIRAACGIDETDAYFAYDSARINARARQILEKIAKCFKDGPLAGKAMRLVGHADPRGGEEYNLLLGGRRADSVKGTLVSSGLSGSRVSTTSRGEMEATGTDEASWAKDRRVDVLLGGSS
jgi:peptidoglycan-associated lipoprotein